LPGVGENTAGAVLAYAFNRPVAFIETNIRAVILHHFYPEQTAVRDQEILKTLKQIINQKNPREFYWAMMDYGAYLKSKHPNPGRRSSTYSRQSKFEGSRRQMRGAVLRELLIRPHDVDELSAKLSDIRLRSVLLDLEKEGMIISFQDKYQLADLTVLQ
jgi:A/G-specific adenine glycosylase